MSLPLDQLLVLDKCGYERDRPFLGSQYFPKTGLDHDDHFQEKNEQFFLEYEYEEGVSKGLSSFPGARVPRPRILTGYLIKKRLGQVKQKWGLTESRIID